MSIISKYEYWKKEFRKLDQDHDLAVKERRVTQWKKDNSDRISGLFQLKLQIGFETTFKEEGEVT